MVPHAFNHQGLIQRANDVDSIVRIAVGVDSLGSTQETQIPSSGIVGNGVTSCQVTVEVIILKVLSIYVEITVRIVRALHPNLTNKHILNH